ncbi:MAG TPA: YetF domain-containing protein [Gemmatimonadales bacterium]|nr:YetF domain-containing protein [Gemmatimonadales bacterium]
MISSLLSPDIADSEKILRTIVVYAFLLIGLRLAGKRELSQLNPFDLVVLLLLSNTVQNAIIGNDNSLIGGLVGAAVLLIMNAVVVRLLYHFGKLDTIEGRPDTLVRNGRILRHHLERELITVAELEAAARRQGISSLAHVRECRIETGGALTFIQKEPTTEDLRHHELLGLVSQIEARQRELATQVSALARNAPGTTGTTP